MQQPLSLETWLIIEFKGTIDFSVSAPEKIRYFPYTISMLNCIYDNHSNLFIEWILVPNEFSSKYKYL